MACKCDTDDSVLSTPFGSVAIKHCGLSSNCFGKKETEEKEDDAAMRQINIAIRAELILIEHEMRKQMLSHLKAHGAVMPVLVNRNEAQPGRQLSVRIETSGDLPEQITNSIVKEPEPDSQGPAETEHKHEMSDVLPPGPPRLVRQVAEQNDRFAADPLPVHLRPAPARRLALERAASGTQSIAS